MTGPWPDRINQINSEIKEWGSTIVEPHPNEPYNKSFELDVCDDVAENVTNGGSEQSQNDDNHYGH